MLLVSNLAMGQGNVIDLGTDTTFYDKEFEYIAAVEIDKYMESYLIYQTALDAYNNKDLLSAKAAISKAIKMNRKENKFRMLKSWVFSREKAYKKAIKNCRKILEDSPKHKEALYCMALNQYLLKAYASADETYSKLLEADPYDFRAYYGRAEVKIERQDLQGAIADYNTALAINTTMQPAYSGRGLAYYRLFNYHSAIKDFNQFLVANPNSGQIAYYRGMSYLRLNDYSNACKDFEKAYQLNYKEASSYYSKYCKF
ncbi:MAG: tetratricopeptide repeat protein [Bacteroidetes bacterium]|nr:tetratricopeptide repeat protein [Bacteroidota bacterium]